MQKGGKTQQESRFDMMASLLLISPIKSIEPVISARFDQNVSGAVHLSA
jgi:hypothetical protein